MTYQQARSTEIRNSYDHAISRFLSRYRKGRPTIVFLPGGMGSQLRFSTESYKSGPTMPTSQSSVAWYDLGLLFNDDLSRLEMTRADGDFEDHKRHVVTPDGEVRFLFKPYDRLRDLATDLDHNFIVFGFDWRRSLIESVGFLRFFLGQLRQRVRDQFDEDIAPDLIFLGHSQGGLVLHLWLIREFRKSTTPSEVTSRFARAIFVGTPFYGTTNHMPRYYRGEAGFNELLGMEKVRRILTSLPGPYILMPLDERTFNDRVGVFEKDGYLTPVNGDPYPVLDKADPHQRADPFAEDNQFRFPHWVPRSSLAESAQLRRTLSLSLPEPVVAQVYCIRATAPGTTITTVLWDADPDAGADAMTGIKGAGDGTVPAWSGALTEIPRGEGQVFDLPNAGGHVSLMENAAVQNVLVQLINRGRPVATPTRAAPSMSAGQVRTLATEIRDGRANSVDKRAQSPAFWRGLIEGLGECKD